MHYNLILDYNLIRLIYKIVSKNKLLNFKIQIINDMEDSIMKARLKQSKSHFLTLRPQTSVQPSQPRTKTPTGLSETHSQSLSNSSSLRRNKLDPLRSLRKMPEFTKAVLTEYKSNNKENKQRKNNSTTLRNTSESEYCLGERQSREDKGRRLSAVEIKPQKVDSKMPFAKNNESENVKSNLVSSRVSIKPNLSLMPNIYNVPIKEDTDRSSFDDSIDSKNGEPANINGIIYKNKNVEPLCNEEIDVYSTDNSPRDDHISMRKSVRHAKRTIQEDSVSDAYSKSQNANSFEDTFFGKNKSALVNSSHNHTFSTERTSATTTHRNKSKARYMHDTSTEQSNPILVQSYDVLNDIKFVSANTNKGCVRNYNEDRISIVLNIKTKNDEKYSYFGMFDGHAGAACSEFLKDTLHKYVIAQKNLFDDFEANISKTFKVVDELFKETALTQRERSGSCALTMFFNKGRVYFANVGDCRAIASSHSGTQIHQLTIDHKPENEGEKERVFANGGYFYATNTFILKRNGQKMINGPLRVFPGKLTTTRSFGDFDAKLPQLGGVPGVVISEPEFSNFAVDNMDFVILGCDGLYENITNEEIMIFVHGELNALRQSHKPLTRTVSDNISRRLVEYVIDHGSSDNVSAVVIFFEKFVNSFEQEIH